MNKIIVVIFVVLSVQFTLAANNKYIVQNKREWVKNNNEWFNSVVNSGKISVPQIPKNINATYVANTTLIEYYRELTVGLLSRKEFVLPMILDEIWMSVVENETSLYQNSVSRPFLSVLRDLFGQDLTLYSTSNSRVPFSMVRTYTTQFRDAMAKFKKSLNNTALANTVQVTFAQLEAALANELVSGTGLRKEAIALQQLPMFSVAATSHLFLLNEAMRFGSRWGLNTTDIASYQAKFNLYIRDYLEYVGEAYIYGLNKIFDPDTDYTEYTVEEYQLQVQYKNAFILSVSDFANYWWLLDSKLVNTGIYSDRVRYIFSDIVGYNVDDPVDINGEGVYSNYYTPTYSRMLEMSSVAQIERFQGTLSQVKIEYQAKRFMYSIESYFIDPTDYTSRIANDIVGEYRINSTSQLFNFGNTYNTQSFSYSHDVLPRMISFSNLGSATPLIGKIDLANKCNSQGSTACKNYYLNKGILFNGTHQYANHKIGNVFSWNSNADADSNGLIIDSITVGFLPVEVFQNNLVQKTISSVIDAQKYLSQDGAEFQPDYNDIPGNHVMFLANESMITYRLDSAYSSDHQFSLSLHCILNDKRPASISLYDKTQTLLTTFNLAYTPFSQILSSSNPRFYLTLNAGEVNNDITFIVNGGQIALQSLILTPV